MKTSSEVIVNLWYFVDKHHQVIHSLAGRAYIAEGSDDEKTHLLKQLAGTDFPLATRLPVPDRYQCDCFGNMLTGFAHVSELDNPATLLFEEIYQAIDNNLAEKALANGLPVEIFKIPDNPLFVMTALYEDDAGIIHVLG